MLALFLIVPLLGLIVTNLFRGKFAARLAVFVGVAVSLAQVVLVAVHPAGAFAETNLFKGFLHFTLAADNLSLLPLLLVGLVVFVAVLVAICTMSDARQLYQFMNVLLIAMIGMNGIALATDLFSMYVFLEVTSVASFILIALPRTSESLEGSFTYVILSAVASILMLAAMGLLLLTTGSMSFSVLAEAFKNSPANFYNQIAVGAFVCGLFIKAGLVPFHGWVMGAYAMAPTATSVLLAGVASKISGVYTLIRMIVSIFGFSSDLNQILLLVGAVSAVIGALAALSQSDMKRLLAYSSISQMGYIVLGLGCGSALGLLGAMFHFFNHAVFKSLLFVNSAALEQRVGTTDMNRMGGLGARMPWTSVTSMLASLSTAGIPPLAGFWSKLIIIIALWKAGQYVYVVIAILVSVLTLAYMLVLQRKIFFGKLREGLEMVQEASAGLLLPAVVLAVITVAVGVAVPFVAVVFNVFEKITAGFFPA